jgi:hypothetical protein
MLVPKPATAGASSASPRPRTPRRDRVTSTPAVVRRAWTRTAPPVPCTGPTTVRCNRSAAPRTTPPRCRRAQLRRVRQRRRAGLVLRRHHLPPSARHRPWSSGGSPLARRTMRSRWTRSAIALLPPPLTPLDDRLENAVPVPPTARPSRCLHPPPPVVPAHVVDRAVHCGCQRSRRAMARRPSGRRATDGYSTANCCYRRSMAMSIGRWSRP